MRNYILQILGCSAVLLVTACPQDGIRMNLASSNERIPHPSFAVTYDKGMEGRIDSIRCAELERRPRGLVTGTVWHAVSDGDFGELSPVVDMLSYGVTPVGFTDKVPPQPLKPGGRYVMSVGKGGEITFRVSSDGRATRVPAGQ